MHRVITLLQHEEFQPYHILAWQGSFLKSVYFINKGSAVLQHADKDHREYDVCMLGEGSYYGEYQILATMRSMFRLRVPERKR